MCAIDLAIWRLRQQVWVTKMHNFYYLLQMDPGWHENREISIFLSIGIVWKEFLLHLDIDVITGLYYYLSFSNIVIPRWEILLPWDFDVITGLYCGLLFSWCLHCIMNIHFAPHVQFSVYLTASMFLFCCPDFPSCSINLNIIDWVAWATRAALKK